MAPVDSTSKKRKKTIAPAPYDPPTALTKAAARHRGKPTNHKKKKKVKVSAAFKDKVVKSLAGKTPSGSWNQVSFDSLRPSAFNTNQQVVIGLGEIQSNDASNWAFDPIDFLHGASVLFNGKLDSQGNRAINQTSNMFFSGYTGGGGSTGVSDLNQPFSSRLQMNGKLQIKNSYENYKLKNNTQRTMVIKIYLCAPKRHGFAGNQVADIPPGTDNLFTTPAVANIGSPGGKWADALDTQVFQNINMASTTPSTLYNSPKDCPVFNQTYKTDCTTFIMEPGQVCDYFIQGPQNFELDYSKMFENTTTNGGTTGLPVYHGIRKHMRFPLMVAYLDLVTDGSLCGHYPTSAALGEGLALCVERQMKFSLEAPESTGARLGVAGTSPQSGDFENNLRRDCYFRTIYTPVAAAANLNTVNVQQPASVVDQT